MKDENDLARRIQELGSKLEHEKKEREEEKTKLNNELTALRELIRHLQEVAETQSTELEGLQEANAVLQEVVDRVDAPPQTYGRIVRAYEENETVDVDVEGSTKLLTTRPGVSVQALTVGTLVRIDAGTGTVTERAPFDDVVGDERKLVEFLNDRRALVEDKMGHKTVIRLTDTIDPKKVDGGARIIVTNGFMSEVLDEGNEAVIAALSSYTLGEIPDMSFDDIAGHEELIRTIYADIMDPYEHPELMSYYDMEPGFKYVFYGPPGNGKTSLVKAIARMIYDRFEEQIKKAGVKGNLIAIHGPELSSKWMGETEERMRTVFEGASKLYELTGCPVVVSIDDCESFLLQRGTSNASTANMDYVNQFNTLLEGVRELRGVSVILTTNRIDLLDTAVIRRMRDMKKYVGPPDTPEKVEAVLRKHVRKIKLDPSSDPIPALVARIFDTSQSNDAIEISFQDSEPETIPLSEFISGSLLRDIVHGAKKIAKERAKKLSPVQPVPINLEDLMSALENELENNESLPSTRTTVEQWLRQRGDKRVVYSVNALRDKKKQESREKEEIRVDRAVI